MAKKYIPVKTKKESGRIYLEEIIYIEKNLRKTRLITTERTIELYCNMDYVKQFTDERFMDCHRSYLFNMDKIIVMTNQTVYMENGREILLGRESFRRGRRILEHYLNKEKT